MVLAAESPYSPLHGQPAPPTRSNTRSICRNGYETVLGHPTVYSFLLITLFCFVLLSHYETTEEELQAEQFATIDGERMSTLNSNVWQIYVIPDPKDSEPTQIDKALDQVEQEAMDLDVVSNGNRDKYDVFKKSCFEGFDLSHVNNKPDSHDSCFAACMAWNLKVLDGESIGHLGDDQTDSVTDEKDKLCIGWSSRKGSTKKALSLRSTVGTKTCFLKWKLDTTQKYYDRSCSSAKLWDEVIDDLKEELNEAILIEEPGKEEWEILAEEVYWTYEDMQEYYAYQQQYYEEQTRLHDEEAADLFDFQAEDEQTPEGLVIKVNKTEYLSDREPTELPSSQTEDSMLLDQPYSDDGSQGKLLAYSEPIVLRECSLQKNIVQPMDMGRPIRTFVFCAQASGCTLLTYLLAQQNDSVAILDVGVRQVLPSQSYFQPAHENYPETKQIIMKQSIRGKSKKHSIKNFMATATENFDPDYTILFLRHPVDTFLHLINHIGEGTMMEPRDADFEDCFIANFAKYSYGLRCGTPVAKLKALNEAYVKRSKLPVSQVILYEDICRHDGRIEVVQKLRKDGICVTEQNFQSPHETIISVMKKTMTLFPSTRQASEDSNETTTDEKLFWGAGDLQNTFHAAESWEEMTEEEIFSQCESLENTKPVDERRRRLLRRAGMPYKRFSLETVIALVEKNAPDLIVFYNQHFPPT